jgi:anti-sigma regulatory factor (Ser/Thr protein kinase)
MRACFELRTKSSLDDLSKISDFVLDSTRESSLDERETFHLMTAVDEACANIIKYSGSDEIDLKCEVEVGLVVVEIRDEGVAFNPLEAPKPDINAPLEEREVGGLGIYLIRTLMNDVKYERQGRKNVLTMTLRHQ